jgi:hypothetical protein
MFSTGSWRPWAFEDSILDSLRHLVGELEIVADEEALLPAPKSEGRLCSRRLLHESNGWEKTLANLKIVVWLQDDNYFEVDHPEWVFRKVQQYNSKAILLSRIIFLCGSRRKALPVFQSKFSTIYTIAQ